MGLLSSRIARYGGWAVMVTDAAISIGKYAMGYAVAPALEGPYTKPLAKAWLGTSNNANGLVRATSRQHRRDTPRHNHLESCTAVTFS